MAMSLGNVSSGSPPKDIVWHPVDLPIPVEITQLGKNLVESLTDNPGLRFVAVEAAWTIHLASRYGKLYALIIKATPANGIPGDYLAIARANLAANFEQVLSFEEYSAAQ